jgi:tetratricopeptide (TPR) repeat protein
MLSLIFLAAVSIYLYRLLGGLPPLRIRRQAQGQAVAAKIDELTEYASRLRATKKYSAAEQVYMQILELDQRHVSTYSRLGTLYSAQHNYGDAIECFEMTTQLAPSGSTFYNLGLAYFENRNYLKAVAAFEKAIMFEPTLQRYVGLAKAFRKINDDIHMIEALEQAVRIEASPKVMWLLADAYATAGRDSEALAIQQRIREVNPKDERLRAMRAQRKGATRPAPKVEKPA